MLNVFSSILRTYEMDNSARVILTKVPRSVATIAIRKKNIGRISNEIKRLSTRDIGQCERNRDITASLGRARNRNTAISQAETKLRFPDKQRSRREALLLREQIVAAERGEPEGKQEKYGIK